MQYSQEHLKTMVYAKFEGQIECIMGNWKIENSWNKKKTLFHVALINILQERRINYLNFFWEGNTTGGPSTVIYILVEMKDL